MDRAEAVLASHGGRHDAATAAAYRRVADETPSSPRVARALDFAAFGHEAASDLCVPAPASTVRWPRPTRRTARWTRPCNSTVPG